MDRLILVTGATGYVGGRLTAALERAGHRVRCLARRPETLHGRVGVGTEVVAGDCLNPASLVPAQAGVHTAYYLVHSMGATKDFSALDREAAREFGRAAREAGVRRIVYLGGLGEPSDELSAHLKSRQETGDILRQSGVPVVEFRASVVIGSGSLSFEMVRALVERLPVLICPKWVAVATQPIGIEDLITYLATALDLPEGLAAIFPIGGPDVVSYGDIMREYARQRGLRRWFISVPVLTPRLSSLWLGLVTPLYARVGRKLIDSLKNPTIVRDDSALRAFAIRPRSLREAIARAASLEDGEQAAARWSDALSSGGVRPAGWGGARLGTRIVDSRAVTVEAPPAAAFTPVRRIGGAQGWYCGNALWQLRGFLDLLVGGIGMRRGRRDPEVPHPGDALDFWRVEAYEPDRLLRLAAEMKIPGRAWLQFEVTPQAGGGCEIRQTAIFDPAGLAGLLYWYALYPLHAVIFRGMLAGIAARASSGGARRPRHNTHEVLA
ncbi:MAG: SDR family oxidoreductase [Zetaproteobacteria bacterium]|nr:MAG: SDR family oxidoreductase [Zetaproteobacteria bacterium]